MNEWKLTNINAFLFSKLLLQVHGVWLESDNGDETDTRGGRLISRKTHFINFYEFNGATLMDGFF